MSFSILSHVSLRPFHRVTYQGGIDSVMELRERGLRAIAIDPTVTLADREEFEEKMGIIAVRRHASQ